MRFQIRAGIHQHKDVFRRRYQARQARAIHAFERAKFEVRRCEQRAGVAGRDNGIGLARFDQVNCSRHRAVFLATDGLDGRVIHFDNLAGMNQLQPRVSAADSTQLSLNAGLVADEEQSFDLAETAQGVHRARDHVLRGVIAAHGIHGNSHS